MRDPLLANPEVIVPDHYVAAEVIATKQKITRRGETMVFASLRGESGIMEVRAFRSISDEIHTGKCFAALVRDDVVVDLKPLTPKNAS